MSLTPHYEKIKAAIDNIKVKEDIEVLKEILKEYEKWVKQMDSIKSKGEQKVKEMVKLLNEYEDKVEVDLILEKGTDFLIRQKGQLKLDNTIMEEFLIRLMDPDIIEELKGVDFLTGPSNAFLSLSFRPQSFSQLGNKPEVILKTKDCDFILGKEIHYMFSSDEEFTKEKTNTGSMVLAVLASECKINLDKTMFQECAGTAARLKSGVPYAKYFVIIEFLDMVPEDCRLTELDNVFLIRKAKRLPYEKRNDPVEVRKHRKNHPIDAEVILRFVREVKEFLGARWYDPDAALKRGSFN